MNKEYNHVDLQVCKYIQLVLNHVLLLAKWKKLTFYQKNSDVKML